jgi:LysM repeat protein
MTARFEPMGASVIDTVDMRTVNDAPSRHPLTGIVPAVFLRAPRKPRHVERAKQGMFTRSLFATVPIVLIGSLAMSLAVATPADAAPARKLTKQKAQNVPKPVKVVPQKTIAAPATYRVKEGDTVSSVAGQYGLSTASVLTLNGLGWKSMIFPGQVLKLSKAAATNGVSVTATAATTKYTIAAGDTVATIAQTHGVSTNAVLTANGLKSTSVIFPGQKLSLPDPGSFSSTDVDTVSMDLVSNVTPTTTDYVIATGDTMTSVAEKFGVSVSALLAANSLSATSLIYAGKAITIPKAAIYVEGRGVVTVLTAEMSSNAKTIIAVGRSIGATDRALVVALATAMQESGLKNIPYGDRDSVGLFQQRPSKGWGSVKQILNATYATKAFFLGVGDDTPGLFDIRGWESMTVTRAAQSVQVSAFPNAYAQWETSARYWLDELG